MRGDTPWGPLDYHHAARVDAAMDDRRGTVLDRSLRPDPGSHEGSWKMIGFPGTLTNEQHEAALKLWRKGRDADELRAALDEALDMLTIVDEATNALSSAQAKRHAELRKLVKP
jgi:hypothetical protein